MLGKNFLYHPKGDRPLGEIGIMILVDGNKIATKLLSQLGAEFEKLAREGLRPKLAVFLVGENPASVSYIKLKTKKADEIGIEVELHSFDDQVSEAELIDAVKEASKSDSVCGILVQLPLPERINRQKVLDAVPVHLDVDSLNSENKQAVIKGSNIRFVPPAAKAVLEILDYHQINLKNSDVVIVGTGDLIGKPLAALLLARGVNFEMANTHTENLPELLAKADVVVTGVGKAGLITGEMIKSGAVVIDAGTTGSEEGGVTGDVERDSVSEKARLLAPVPEGVGPVTVAMLFQNFLTAARQKLKT